MITQGLLSWLIWFPIGSGILLLIASRFLSSVGVRTLGLLSAVMTLCLGFLLYQQYDPNSHEVFQLLERHEWIAALHIQYALGVDGIAAILIVLSVFTNLIVILAAQVSVKEKLAEYMGLFLLSTGIMNGVFAAQDAILFYVFWEASLIPMYLAIGVWGSEERSYAAMKFFLYTFLGSVLMLLAFIVMGYLAGSFEIAVLQKVSLNHMQQCLCAIAFFAAFAVKIPMWPLHTWLPDAHTQAPAGGSVVLAALMLKMGAYGFIRFSLPILAQVHAEYDWILIALSLVAVVYVGLATIMQTDMKRLIAYSSISHMGIVTLGLFIVFMIIKHTHQMNDATTAMQGAVFQMISHAFSASGLFIGVGFIYDRFHTRKIADYGGLAHVMPIFATFYVLFAMTNVGLPGTSGFVGEFLVIVSAFKANFTVALLAGLTLLLAPAYTLWMIKRVLFGEVVNTELKSAQDLGCVEVLVFILLALPTLVLGLYPQSLLAFTESSVNHLLTTMQIMS